MFSDDTELFPLSTLLYNREHAPDKEYWAQFGIEHVELPTVEKYIKSDWSVSQMTTPGVKEIPLDGTVTIYNDTDDDVRVLVQGERDSHRIAPGEDAVVTNIPDYDSEHHSIHFYKGTASTAFFHTDTVRTDGVVTVPIISSIWDRICLRVNEAYYDRFLGGETLEQWQRRLQVITDRIIPRYERNFRIYKDNKDKLEKAIGMTQTTTYNNVKDAHETDMESKVSETPDTAINEDQNYAGSVSRSTGKKDVNYSLKTGSVTTSMTPNGGLIEQLNDNMDAWRDLESDLVNEYAKAFLSCIWY